MPMRPTFIRKVKPRHADIVSLDSPVFPEDEARNREFMESTDPRDSARLPYEIDSLADPEYDPLRPHRSLGYDIGALPGRHRFEITSDGEVVIPGTGAEALNYYGVGKKLGANIGNLKPVMLPAMGEVAAAAQDLRLPRPIITAGSDGRHKRGSLHYKNLGLDLRGNNITDTQGRKLRDIVKTRLGQNYDVFFEQKAGQPMNDHVHVEFDPPKGKAKK